MPNNSNWAPRVLSILRTFTHGKNTLHLSQPVRDVLIKYENQIMSPLNYQQLPLKKKVFTNNYLNLGEINVIGFDLDYTLVPYTEELQSLIYTMARDILVDAYGFQKDLKGCFFDPNFAIRGLSVDTQNGVLLKLNQLQRVGIRYSYKGKRQLTSQEMDEFYGPSRHITVGDLSKMRPLNDLFSLAEACLIADAIEISEHIKATRGEDYSPNLIIDDVQAAIRDVHISGSMHNAVIADLDRFVKYNPQLPDLLLHLRKADKKLFLATNSGFGYADRALAYAIGITNKDPLKASKEWREMFDIVICTSQKPDFFCSKKPFRKWNFETDRPTATPIGQFNSSDVYVHGSAQILQRVHGWKGKEILYIGDNLRADLVEASRWNGWQTGCIINELDREIDIQNTERFAELHFLRTNLRNIVMDLQSTMMQTQIEQGFMDSDCVTNSLARDCRPIDFGYENDQLIKTFESLLHKVNADLSMLFNPQFGSMFRTDGHPSLFAFAVRRYADIYMSEVCHLLNYSPNHRFYPSHALHMAHDPTYQ